MKKIIILIAIFALIFASCKKTELIEIKEVKQENVTLKNIQAPENSYTLFLCAMAKTKEGPIFGWKCDGGPGICNRRVPNCTPFPGNSIISSDFGEILLHELIVVDYEMINENMSLFETLINDGTVVID